MKRLVLSFLLVIAFVSAIIYLSAGFVLGYLTDQGIKHLKQNAGKYGYQIHDIRFGSAGLASLNSVHWKEVSVDLEVLHGDRERNAYRVSAEIGNISLTLVDFNKKLFEMKMRQLKAFRLADKNESSRDAKINKTIVKIEDFQTRFKLDFTSVKSLESDVYTLIQDIRGIVTHGRTTNPIHFTGNSLFGINTQAVTAGIASEKRGAEYVVTMNPSDLRKIAELLEEDLNEPEIQLLSKNPLRAPKLLRIRNKARSKAEQAYSFSKAISTDAYRHVLWSYLLTVEYGEVFAKLVTDAHEQGDFEDSAADHKMDYHNNSVGRAYAKARMSEDQVLRTAARDSKVIGFVNRVR